MESPSVCYSHQGADAFILARGKDMAKFAEVIAIKARVRQNLVLNWAISRFLEEALFRKSFVNSVQSSGFRSGIF